jgi:hypothetical protein
MAAINKEIYYKVWRNQCHPIFKSQKHGPYAPCIRSPTGEHCWHREETGAYRCCWCGRLK